MEGLGEDLIAKWGEGKEKTLLYYTVNSSRTIQTDTRKKKNKNAVLDSDIHICCNVFRALHVLSDK